MTQAYSPGLPFSYQPQPLFVSAQALELVAIDAIGHDEAQRMLRHAKRQAETGRQQGRTQWYSARTNTTTSCLRTHADGSLLAALMKELKRSRKWQSVLTTLLASLVATGHHRAPVLLFRQEVLLLAVQYW